MPAKPIQSGFKLVSGGKASSKSASYLRPSHVSYRRARDPYVSCRVSSKDAEEGKPHKHAIVIGAGWGGLAAAHALSKAGVKVTVLEAADAVGGLSTASRISGRVTEPGIKGFWHQYRNIEALLAELKIENALTDWTQSSFYSPQGLQVQSPIFKDLPRLPSPLGSFLYTAPYFRKLALTDRLTAVWLVESLLEYDADDDSYAYYDSISAKQLFSKVSPALYRDFLEPILLVTLFAPGDKLSAAAALDCLYYFALAHQADFDVRWCKGPVGEFIIQPFAELLKNNGVNFHMGRRVQQITAAANHLPGRIVTKGRDDEQEVWDADAIILSASLPALKRIAAASPVLAQRSEFARLKSLGAIDVLAVRLWLHSRISMQTPSNVAVGYDQGVGATFFDLTELQTEYQKEAGTVVEVDFYNATPLLQLSDDVILKRTLEVYLAGCIPAFSEAQILDYSITRAPNAVTAFSPKSAANLPLISTSFPNIFTAGDFVAQGPRTHGAKGLSQEKAFVAGLQAGNLAAEYLGYAAKAQVIPVEGDEPHIRAAKAVFAQRHELFRRLQI